MLWNDFAYEYEGYTGDEKELDGQPLKYVDNVVPIGKDSYCNWVANHYYGRNAGNLRVEHTTGYMEPWCAIAGPGGRCLIMQIDNDTWDDNFKTS
jgi:hypothetical protein